MVVPTSVGAVVEEKGVEKAAWFLGGGGRMGENGERQRDISGDGEDKE